MIHKYATVLLGDVEILFLGVLIRWEKNIILLNILIMLNKILIQWFWVDVTTSSPRIQKIELNYYRIYV